MSNLEALKKAREYFAENGGHRGGYANRETGKVCALGALNYTVNGNAFFEPVPCEQANPLHQSARELYGDHKYHPLWAVESSITVNVHGIVDVNDYIGFEAALHVYDHAIKTMENEE